MHNNKKPILTAIAKRFFEKFFEFKTKSLKFKKKFFFVLLINGFLAPEKVVFFTSR